MTALFIERGWSVLPLQAKSKIPATRLVPKGYLSASSDPEKIERWFADESLNLGIACIQSGLVVIDIDNGEMIPEASETYTVKTERGFHLYYLAKEGVTYAGKLRDGVDVKHKGYVVAPPSVHPSGSRYKLLNDMEPTPLPEAIAKQIERGLNEWKN
jgi:hypothetical protein